MSEDWKPIVGCRIQRIDAPHRHLIALSCYRASTRGVWLIGLEPRGARWGWVDRRPRGAPASAFVQLMRKRIQNARLVEVRPETGELVLRRGEEILTLALDDGLVLRVADEALARLAAGARRALPTSFAELTRSGPALASDILGRDHAARLDGLSRGIRTREKALRRRLAKIEVDIGRAAEVEPMRENASLLLAHLSRIPTGADVAVVPEWNSTSDPPATRRIQIDPRHTAREEADALFRRAGKLERGARIGAERRHTTKSEIARLAELTAGLPAIDEDELTRRETAARRLGVRIAHAAGPTPASREAKTESRAFRIFSGSGDRSILVGRGARDNDTLTLQHARPWDHWLHVKGRTGSHVVIPLEKKEACPPALLIDAAHLAVHFSDARGEASAEVTHVPRRHVRKPRGAAAGSVTVQREKVLLLRVDAERLERLLARKSHPIVR